MAKDRTPEQNKLLADNPSANISAGVLYQYNQAFTQFDFGYGSAISMVLTLIIVPGVGAYATYGYITKHLGPSRTGLLLQTLLDASPLAIVSRTAFRPSSATSPWAPSPPWAVRSPATSWASG